MNQGCNETCAHFRRINHEGGQCLHGRPDAPRSRTQHWVYEREHTNCPCWQAPATMSAEAPTLNPLGHNVETVAR